MIWIYEELSKAEFDHLETLNPFMDYTNNGTSQYGFKSRKFEYYPNQKIAVRVISQFGEESTKVL